MNRTSRTRGALTLCTTLVALVLFMDLPGTAGAAGFDLNAGYGYSSSDRETENRVTGQSSESSSTTLSQRYNLYFSRDIYPYLIFTGGGNFRIDDTESEFEGNLTEVKRTSIRPYLELKVDNPFLQTGVGYRDFEDRQKVAGGARTARFNRTRYAFLSLEPDQLPELDLMFSRADRSSDPETVDIVEDQTTAHTRYDFTGGNVDYTYSQNITKDNLNDFRTGNSIHNLKFHHSSSYLDGKVRVSTGYWFSHSETDLEGTGSALIPQLRSAGLFSLDISPEDGPALESAGGLIDGETAVPTSLDIGLAGDETTLTNIGVDTGFTASVDTIHLWVDRELTQEVSDSFTWYVYTSPDNTDTSDWQLHATISPGEFDTFENRFDITFASVDTRFIKVVVMPLLPSVTGASGFPNIFITEMEVFSTLTSQDEISSTRHRLDYNINWRVTERTSVGYDWFYRHQESDPANVEESTMTNGLFVNHRFNGVFSGSARVSRRNREEVTGNSAVNSFNASLRADHMRTFRQTLTYSGNRTFDNEGGGRTNSVYLRNNADLYRGVSAYLDTGVNWSQDGDEDKTRGTILRVGSKLVPNDIVTMNIDYRANRSRDPEGEKYLSETGSFQAFILPSNSLSMFARLRFDEDEDDRRSTQQYTLSWSPLMGGSVQFLLSYGQVFQSEGNKEEKTLSPGLRWRITRYATLQTAYRWSSSESDTELVDSRSLTANLNLNL